MYQVGRRVNQPVSPPVASKVLAVGLPLFISGFLWAPSNDVLRVVFHLGYLFPLFLLWPWRTLHKEELGGMASGIALALGGLAVLSTQWGSPGDLPWFIWQWLLLAGWLAGVSWWQAGHGIQLQLLYRLLLGLGVLVGISMLWVFYSGQPWGERLVGWAVARNPVLVAQTWGVLVVLAYVLSLQSRQVVASLAYLGLAMVLAVPALLSQSRWPVLGIICVCALAWCLARPGRARLWQHLPVYLLVAGALLTMEPMRFWEARGLSYRDAIWSETWSYALQHPWLGAGYEKDGIIPLQVGPFHHAHNAWLDSFYWLGLAGLAIGLCHLVWVLRACRFDTLRLPLVLWFFYGCFCLLTDSRTLFWEINSKWFLYWIPAGLIVAVRQLPLTTADPARPDPRGEHPSDRS